MFANAPGDAYPPVGASADVVAISGWMM